MQKVGPSLAKRYTLFIFPEKENAFFSFLEIFFWPLFPILLQVSFENTSETNCGKCLKHTFFWMFSEAKPGVELQDKTFDTRCCALDSVCVCKGLKRPCRVFWPDMGGGKVMTSDSLTKV